jgi:hypothetical protein
VLVKIYGSMNRAAINAILLGIMFGLTLSLGTGSYLAGLSVGALFALAIYSGLKRSS